MLDCRSFPKIIYSCYNIYITFLILTHRSSQFIWCFAWWCRLFALARQCFTLVSKSLSHSRHSLCVQSHRRMADVFCWSVWILYGIGLTFLQKVTVRNLLRYKKRFFMTIVGVAGCTALIVTGFGLKYSIKTIAEKQFNEIFLYDGIAVLNSADLTRNNWRTR